MPYQAWVDSKETLHRWLQIVGKIRLSSAPPRNHWWHVPFHMTGRGITTRPMGTDPIFSIDFDFVSHRLVIDILDGATHSFPLTGNTVASFYRTLLEELGELGVELTIDRPEPFDLADHVHFADDTSHRSYDPVLVNRYWRILSRVNIVLEEFAGRFSGKTSPVHHFWHTMDIAVTRFSDKEVAYPATADSVTREAYSREVISFGFWFGDTTFPEPAFYSYTSPEPEKLSSQPLLPDTALWIPRGGSHLAVLRYEEVRANEDPASVIFDFLESAYRAGASLAGWDILRLASPDGTTAVRAEANA